MSLDRTLRSWARHSAQTLAALAISLQALVLPTAHLGHDACAPLLVESASVGSGPQAHPGSAAGSIAHDAAICPICAALAYSGHGVVRPAATGQMVARVDPVLPAAGVVPDDASARDPRNPRAPPRLS
jgi:hypothetical protein